MFTVLWCAIELSAHAEDEADTPIDVSALPAEVAATVAREWPAATVSSAAIDDGDYEVSLAIDGRRVVVVLAPGGTWKELEEKVDAAALPDAVRAAALASGEIVGAERRTRPTGKVDYEVDVRSKKGKIKQLELDPMGHRSEVERPEFDRTDRDGGEDVDTEVERAEGEG